MADPLDHHRAAQRSEDETNGVCRHDQPDPVDRKMLDPHADGEQRGEQAVTQDQNAEADQQRQNGGEYLPQIRHPLLPKGFGATLPAAP